MGTPTTVAVIARLIKRQRSDNDDTRLQPFKRFKTYTELNTMIKEIYFSLRDMDLLRQPTPFKKDLAKRNQSKNCYPSTAASVEK